MNFLSAEEINQISPYKVTQVDEIIISNFFTHSVSDAMLYICSPSDSRQAARARLFKIWFNKTPEAKKFTLQTYSNIEENVEYFYGIILRKDNPYHDKMIKIFIDFFSDK